MIGTLLVLLGSCCHVGPVAGAAPAALERVTVAADGHGFVLTPSGRPFRPWGLNYGNRGRLLEDFWGAEWSTVVDDFRAMKRLGANVVRVHLQLAKFMVGPKRPHAAALRRLGRLVRLAERAGLYLDVTGLGCYRTADVPAWYDRLAEAQRWAVQARFWGAVAARCSASPAVFCYDLMNEPVVPGGRRKPGRWYSGKPFGGYDFVQFISLDPAGRPRGAVAGRWIATLTAAVRKHDRRHLITLGLLPSTPKWGHLSGFIPDKVAPQLDFLSVHIYPEKAKGAEALKTLRQFAVGKPLVVEETFPLACSTAELEAFLRASRGTACGWMGHFDGQTPERLEERRKGRELTLPEALMLESLKLFRKMKPEMTGNGPQRPRR
jgi:hypothetical protein